MSNARPDPKEARLRKILGDNMKNKHLGGNF